MTMYEYHGEFFTDLDELELHIYEHRTDCNDMLLWYVENHITDEQWLNAGEDLNAFTHILTDDNWIDAYIAVCMEDCEEVRVDSYDPWDNYRCVWCC